MAKKKRAVVSGRSILALDVLGEVRRAQRVLRRVEKYLVQSERRARRLVQEDVAQRAELARAASKDGDDFSKLDVEGQA
jgi:hypothetical protein